jgi:ribosomal protein S18 acetylase RimI-like enzyme
MRPDDAPVVADLSTQFGAPATGAEIERRLAPLLGRPDHALLVATIDGDRPIGWIHVCVVPLLMSDPFGEIWGLVVDVEHRGRGVGRRLMDVAEAWARERGLTMMRLSSRHQREGAHRFYERLGYQILKTSYTFWRALE